MASTLLISPTYCSYPEQETREINSVMSITPAFKARRLTSSTFLITEWDDIYNEHPFIYAKFVLADRTMLILDTDSEGH